MCFRHVSEQTIQWESARVQRPSGGWRCCLAASPFGRRRRWVSIRSVGSGRTRTDDSSDRSFKRNQEIGAFICCARHGAVISHARVLRASLSAKLGRKCVISGEEGCTIEPSQLCVVLLTKQFLSDPAALLEAYIALELAAPIVTIMIAGGGYDYETASNAYAQLPKYLNEIHLGGEGALAELLPEEVTVEQVGEKMYHHLTAIIATNWAPAASQHQLDAVVDQICARMPSKRKGLEKAVGPSTDLARALASSFAKLSTQRDTVRLSNAVTSKTALLDESKMEYPLTLEI
ncbi:hypothetical protein AB1Y20_011034 [Prymnesium parvum]|uniref:Uncharacterized protein n=1 Tax=Prymnesium parvum TaxID=97485 RepID=A0AB34INS6_PRYPA